MDTDSKRGDAPADAFEQRVRFHRRVLARGCGRSPTAKLKLALDHAAYCRADAERARHDPTMPICDRTAIFREDRLAQRALAQAMADITPANKPLSLGDLLRADIEQQRIAKAASA